LQRARDAFAHLAKLFYPAREKFRVHMWVIHDERTSKTFFTGWSFCGMRKLGIDQKRANQ